MALVKHTKEGQVPVTRRSDDLLGSWFADWPAWFRRPFVVVPEGLDTMRADEFTEDGTLVVRIEMGGIDPEKDVDISLEGDMLHIGAECREEEETKEREYARHELRYRAFHRDVAVPPGTTEADIKASYKDGILEVRVPMTAEKPSTPPAKIPISKA